MIYLDLNLMETICHRTAVAILNQDNDPIPPFSSHEIGLLDSALNLPKQTYGGRDLYPTLVDKAAALYYSLIKNHPFPNGNKRIATISFLVFLNLNDHWIVNKQEELAQWAIDIANSESSDREKFIDNFKVWLQNNLIKIR